MATAKKPTKKATAKKTTKKTAPTKNLKSKLKGKYVVKMDGAPTKEFLTLKAARNYASNKGEYCAWYGKYGKALYDVRYEVLKNGPEMSGLEFGPKKIGTISKDGQELYKILFTCYLEYHDYESTDDHTIIHFKKA